MSTLDTIRELMGEHPPAVEDPPQGSPAPQPPPMQEYKLAFRLAFDLLQQHTPAERTGEYWTQAAKDVAQITAQRPGDHLLMDLLIAVYSELERQASARDAEAEN